MIESTIVWIATWVISGMIGGAAVWYAFDRETVFDFAIAQLVGIMFGVITLLFVAVCYAFIIIETLGTRLLSNATISRVLKYKLRHIGDK